MWDARRIDSRLACAMYTSIAGTCRSITRMDGEVVAVSSKSSMYYKTFLVLILTGGMLASASVSPQKVFGQQQQPLIAEVRIEGHANVDEPLIRSMTVLKAGNPYNPRDGATTIKQLYRLGLFEDIRIYVSGGATGLIVTVNVKEYPLLDRLEFEGNDKIKDDELERISGIFQGQALSPFRRKSVLDNITGAYYEKGYLLATLNPRVLVERNNAILRIEIDEGEKVGLGEIFIENNVSVPEKELQKAFRKKADTEEEHFWKEGDLRRERLLDQFEKIVQEYRKHGFRDAEVVSDTLWFSEDRKRMYIKVDVKEGRRYYLGDVAFEGNTKFTGEQLTSLIKIDAGQPFNEEEYQESVSTIYEAYGELGYLYATPIARESAANDSTIDLRFAVNEGEPAKVHRINIVGNTKTKDKVIRRELLIKPGQFFRRSVLMRSQRDVFQLNYFQDVQPGLQPRPNGDVDITFNVLEKPTGTANAGAGYSGLDGLVGTISMIIPNFLGNGQNVNFNWEFGARRNSISTSFVEPWLFDTPTSAGIDIFRTNRQWFREFNIIQKGFGTSLGRRFRGTYWRINGAYRFFDLAYTGFSERYYAAALEDTTLTETQISAINSNIRQRVSYESNSGLTSQVSFSVTRDSRDFPQFATRGMRHTSRSDVAGVGGDVKFLKQTLESDYYVPLFKGTSLSLRGRYAIAVNPFNDREVPFFERFFPGGVSFDGMIRGYGNNSIGPYTDLGDGTSSRNGGRAMSIITLEYQVPIIDQLSSQQPVYAVAFAEAGNAWAKLGDATPLPGNMKKSVGVGIRVIMPLVGLLGFDIGYGFDQPSDPIQALQKKRSGWHTHFQLGQMF